MRISKPQLILKRFRQGKRGAILPAESIEMLSRGYGIHIHNFEKVSKRDHVHDSGSFLVETEKGKMILREHYRNACEPSLLYEYSLLQFLLNKNFKVPRPLLTRDGKSFLKIGKKYYVFFDFIPGYMYRDYFIVKRCKIKYIEQAAETLGRFHHSVKDFKPEGQKPYSNYKETKKRMESFYDFVKNKPESDAFDYFFLNRYNFLMELLNHLGEVFESFEPLQRCIVHEDFGPYNLIFKDGRLAGILDFMDAHLDWRARDVVFSLWIFTSTRKGYYDENLMRLFLHAYQTHCHITSDEMDVMADLFCLKRLNEMPQYLTAHYIEDGNDPLYPRMFTDFVNEIQWHRENKEHLIKSCIKCMK